MADDVSEEMPSRRQDEGIHAFVMSVIVLLVVLAGLNSTSVFALHASHSGKNDVKAPTTEKVAHPQPQEEQERDVALQRAYFENISAANTVLAEDDLGSIPTRSADARAAKESQMAILLWDIETSVELAALHGHGSEIFSPAFTPDESRLYSGSWDGMIRQGNTLSAPELHSVPPQGLARSAKLEPLLLKWLYEENHKDAVVLELMDSTSRDRSPKDVVTLRNLVLKHLFARRQAQAAALTEVASP